MCTKLVNSRKPGVAKGWRAPKTGTKRGAYSILKAWVFPILQFLCKKLFELKVTVYRNR